METRTYKVNLRNNYYNALSVGLSQYDTGVILDFEVYDGAEAATFDSGTTAKIQGVRPSGVGFNANCTLSGNIATVTTTTDMTGEYGTFPVELRFYSSGVDVGTINFNFAIEKAAHPDGTIDADITHEQDIVDKINQILVQTTPDTTLSEAGVAADSKTVGDNINLIKRRLTDAEDNIEYLSQHIDRTDKIKAPVIWEEASGNPVVFDDGANMYIKDLTLTLTPSQDLNGYDYAWAGGNGKNKLSNTARSITSNGVTFTVNADGTVTANGTSTSNSTQFSVDFSSLSGNYKFCGCPNGGGDQTYDVFAWDNTVNARFKKWDGTTSAPNDNGEMHLQEIQVPEGHSGRIVIRVRNGVTVNNLVFKPMIVDADITDNTFAPYENICPINGAESVTVKRTGKNLLENIRTSTTSNGVTFTVNADGTVTANGTATGGNAQFQVTFSGLSGDYLFCGCPSGGGSRSYDVYAWSNTTGARFKKWDGTTASDSDFGEMTLQQIQIPSGSSGLIVIRIVNGATVNNVVFKPMILPASISDNTYEPYSGIDTNVDFGQTIYGGTVNPILWDSQSGGIVFDRKVFSVGDLTWSKQSATIFKATPDNVTGSADYDMSDTFRRNPVADSAMQNGDFKLTVAGSLYVKMEGFGTAAGFKAAYADAKFCAKLAHSEIGAMPPTDRREITTAYLDNVITAQPDKGNVTNIKATYPADTKAYIDKAIAAISG